MDYKRTEEAIREEERKRKRLIHSINMPKNIMGLVSRAGLTPERQDVIGELLEFISYKW